MKRFKKHKVKLEKTEASTSNSRHVDEYDLTYYIHDRVELMHQVFTVLRQKDLKTMTPECVQHISLDDLQELCTEELLGISSKRLCAVLDGAEPPSDTESSSESPEPMETISLDSISSDEAILSETSSRKSKKHKRHRRDSKTKRKRSKRVSEEAAADTDISKASRAGLTVLELLELQARARAIRAQLQQDQAAKQLEKPAETLRHSSDNDNEVEIKEEPTEVVEISSEDEKPKIEELRGKTAPDAKEISEDTPSDTPSDTPGDTPDAQAVTKRINNLIITIPQSKQSKRIKLKRSKMTVTVANSDNVANDPKITKELNNDKDVPQNATQTKNSKATENSKDKDAKTKERHVTIQERVVKVKEKKKKKRANTKHDSDHDEITLQLSDTEKMDLLEDLDRKNFEKLSSSDSEDSDSSSSDSAAHESDKDPRKNSSVKQTNKNDISNKEDTITNKNKDTLDTNKDSSVDVPNKKDDLNTTDSNVEVIVDEPKEIEEKSPINVSQEPVVILDEENEQMHRTDENTINVDSDIKINEENIVRNDDNIEITSIKDIPIIEDEPKEEVNVSSSEIKVSETIQDCTETYTNNTPNSPKTDTNQETDSLMNNTVSSAHSPKKDTQTIENTADKNAGELTLPVKITSPSADQIEVIETPTAVIEKANTDNQEPSVQTEEINTNIPGASEKDSKHLSDGELSDKESSDIEEVELKPEVVCISDDETGSKSHKKKKKKEKKSKSKKSKKSKQDFRESGDENFYTETEHLETNKDVESKEVVKVETEFISLEDDNYDDVYEILELSDDSSCYEVEGTVLSKEPTAEEIEALSAKIDEIDREDIVTEDEIREHEQRNAEDTENIEELEKISWKDRYLDSKKVKKVLTTSNIFNALRKKNRDLKKKIEESKNKEDEELKQKLEEFKKIENKGIEEPIEEPIEEGTIEQYNTLEGSTKFVDPVPDIVEKTDTNVENNAQDGENKNGDVVNNGETESEEAMQNVPVEPSGTPPVGNEIKKDAKQLLKMYKRLMKYNDINKQKNPNKKKDPNKKKKKKSSKKKNVKPA